MTSRGVLRHAFVILTISFLLGLAIPPLGHDPRARLFLGSHITGIAIGIWMTTIALLLPRLRLGDRGRRVVWFCAVPANYFGLVVLGILAPVFKFPSVSTPALPAIEGAPAAIVMSGVAVTTVTTLLLCGMILYGLRGETDP